MSSIRLDPETHKLLRDFSIFLGDHCVAWRPRKRHPRPSYIEAIRILYFLALGSYEDVKAEIMKQYHDILSTEGYPKTLEEKMAKPELEEQIEADFIALKRELSVYLQRKALEYGGSLS